MTQWEYTITVHEFPRPKMEGEKNVIECDQSGQCFVHDTVQAGIGWLENLLREKGRKGWELVQFGYHHQELLAIWKKRKETRKKR